MRYPFEKSEYSITIKDGTYTPDFIVDRVIIDVKNSYHAMKMDFSEHREKYEKMGYKFKLVTERNIPGTIKTLEGEFIKGNVKFASHAKQRKFKKVLEEYNYANNQSGTY